MTPQRITGSWFDFYHPNPYEGDTWNATTQRFTANDWYLKLQEMKEAGMDTLVLLNVALHGRAFYPSEIWSYRWDTVCPDPLEAVLDAGDRLGLTIYVGNGFYTTPIMGSLSISGDTSQLQYDFAKELAERYGHHVSFSGWYLPVEAAIFTHFSDEYIAYANRMSDYLRKLGPEKVFIAPYGTRSITGDAKFVDQVRSLDVDYIAYQDEIGVARTTFEAVDETFARLREAHDRAGKPLWSDLEIFQFHGKVLHPAPFERVKRQFEILSKYSDKVLCYQYLGMMNKPGSPVHAGNEASVQLYNDYMAFFGGK